MSFSLANRKALFIAALVAGFFSFARAQSAEQGQPIQFSTPDGQVVSNTVLPSAQAPAAPDASRLSGGDTSSVFSQSSFGDDAPPPPPPAMVSRGNARSEKDSLTLPTTAQIMGVPTMEQIFGLPERDEANNPNNQNGATPPQEESTNVLANDAADSDEPAWARILTGDEVQKQSDSNDSGQTNGAESLFSSLFNSPSSGGFFGDQNEQDAGFGQSPTAQQTPQPQPFDSFDNYAQMSAAGKDGSGSLQSMSQNSAFNSGFDSQSPFELPKAGTLEMLPQAPVVPSVSGQSQSLTPSAKPSWTPQPPPWDSSGPPQLGTMEQRKF